MAGASAANARIRRMVLVMRVCLQVCVYLAAVGGG